MEVEKHGILGPVEKILVDQSINLGLIVGRVID